jgi:acyl transferase domain-containing protein
MLSVATTSSTAERLVRLAGASRTAIAAENAPTAIVISGTLAGIASVRHRAHIEGIAAAPLRARWALHCPQTMRAAAVELAKRLKGLPSRPVRVRVFSPTLGRYYRPSDDLAECLARQLMLRVRFADAIRALIADGARQFIECGPLSGLARSVAEIRAGDESGRRDPLLPPSRNDDAVGAGAGDEEPALTAALAG